MARTMVIAAAIAAFVLLAAFVIRGQAPQEGYAVQNDAGDWSVSHDGLTFTYPSDFGLAVTGEQILVKPMIPPCEAGFDYCFYYLGPKYQDTNFVSAGVRVKKRADLAGESCVATPPPGYDKLPPLTVMGDRYTTARFAPMGGAEAEYYFFGSIYRISKKGSCYELETRLGLSRFVNDTGGNARYVSEEEGREIQAKLLGIVQKVELTSTREKLMFPE